MNNNTSINGLGTITEGEYNHISITGVGKLLGDLKANNIDVIGSCSGNGSLEVKEILVNGHMSYEGEIVSNNLISVNGNMIVKNNLFAENLKVAGNLKINGNCEFSRVNVSGAFNIKGNCEGNNFHCGGAVNIDGLLNADNIELYLYKEANIKEIGGENIVVKIDSKLNKIPLVGKILNSQLKAETIEGDNIFLEYTTAKKVSGKNIVIGEGCIIEEVIYRENIDVHIDSKVSKKTFNGKLDLLK